MATSIFAASGAGEGAILSEGDSVVGFAVGAEVVKETVGVSDIDAATSMFAPSAVAQRHGYPVHVSFTCMHDPASPDTL